MNIKFQVVISSMKKNISGKEMGQWTSLSGKSIIFMEPKSGGK